jgi:hypothetical protein
MWTEESRVAVPGDPAQQRTVEHVLRRGAGDTMHA